MKYDIFISYRREGGAQYARILQLVLQQMGYKVFLDYDELTDGIFGDHIKEAIKEASIFMIILSQHSMDRCVNENDWLRQEILLAVQEQKHIIPVNPDGVFRGLSNASREKIPAEIVNIVNNYQHSEIGFGQTLWVTIELMVKNRIAPKLGERTKIQSKQNIDDINRLASSIKSDSLKTKMRWFIAVVVALVVLIIGASLLSDRDRNDPDSAIVLREELHEKYRNFNLYLKPNLTEIQLRTIESILSNMRRVDDLNIWMSQFEFTKVQWYGLQNEEYDKDDALCPITNVSYGEVYLLLTKLGEMTDLFFALPSVEEWQIVARGGNNCEGMRYAGDDNVDLVAWYKDNSKGTIRPSDGQQGMSPNGLDMYDMSGNVGELCNTPFDGNPAAYTVCGGNFNSPKEDVTVDSRVAFSIDAKDETVVFRVIIRPNFN